MIAEWASIYIIYDASITLFEKAWTWHEVPVPNHLMETESEFAPWDLSKAHILVSTPGQTGNVATCWHQVLSFENSPWAGLGQILRRCLCNHRKTLTKVQKVTFVESKVVLSSSFIWNQPLGWPWANLGALLVQPQKNTDVQCLPLPVFPGRLSYANLHKAGWLKTRM